MTSQPPPIPTPKKVLSIFAGEMTFQNAYLWFVLLSALDLIITTGVLYLDGVEANPIARMVIETFGKPGMIVFKFAMVFVVIAIAEFVGRRKRWAGRFVIYVGIVVTAVTDIIGAVVLSQLVQQAVTLPAM